MTGRVDLLSWCARFRLDGVVTLAIIGGASMLGGCAASTGGTTTTTNTQPQVTISGAGQVRIGATAQLSATVTNEPSSGVTWQVNGVTGGSASVGTISTTGLYTPPSTYRQPIRLRLPQPACQHLQ